MQTAFIVVMILSLLAVLGTLALGVAGMFRGNSPRRQNKLMQYRVLFQAIAIALFAIFMLLYRS